MVVRVFLAWVPCGVVLFRLADRTDLYASYEEEAPSHVRANEIIFRLRKFIETYSRVIP